eukprot:TRINITY_DN8174_c0_g1_i1.p2 TRINITY_DN8174_c0_g1~~TRINITY_DN8174_c0_g1_i1.p2  ORF type:complete len:105 (+),score=6.26 TRINITY_DN8174_c0_g1_i1:45-359(+)
MELKSFEPLSYSNGVMPHSGLVDLQSPYFCDGSQSSQCSLDCLWCVASKYNTSDGTLPGIRLFATLLTDIGRMQKQLPDSNGSACKCCKGTQSMRSRRDDTNGK